MQQAIAGQGVAAEISQTAGTFVCNHVFYALMHQLHRTVSTSQKSNLSKRSGSKAPPSTRGGFIHMPYLPDQGDPYMALDDMLRGVRAACACGLTTRKDMARGAGALS